MNYYNQRIVHTGPYVEIWDYEKSISLNSDTIEGEKVEIGESKNKNQKRKSFDELDEQEQHERLRRMNKTRLDAKWRLLRIVDCNFDNSTSFLTLTTKENIVIRDEFTNMFKKFVKRFNYHVYKTKKSQLKYIGVLERQKRGAWHAHVLLFSVPFVEHNKLLGLWGHGAIRINKLDHLDDLSNAGRYVVKYMEKGIGQELVESFGKKAYLYSRNLSKPIESKMYLDKPLDLEKSVVLYETEYEGKIFRGGHLVNNKVRYRKVLLTKEDEK
ncbi:rolling circle replication-associated protein [Vagococcus zengguangii]|uniref:Rep protein n=1 Tax=Vagococcus zengguangii TaxID=2571750 RepID=A0A4D7CSX5_9ENTE|nr:Rep protein [Vagococcus zengguangii]QCI85541.1 Rep protein [Vagococcus zengguangii]TLG80087.1 Rep protein [Vagococcus zengguangii]